MDDAFARQVEPYRRELTAHCYRLTGSLADAEDVLQESLVRAWRGLPTFEGRSSLRSWLYKIATNTCLNALEKRGARGLPLDAVEPGDPRLPPAPPVFDPIWLDPCPEPLWEATTPGPDARYGARESVALAFLAALQTLPPLQRAVLVLREVMGWSAAETAELLDTTAPAVNSALQRGRATLAERRERLVEGEHLLPEDANTRELLARYVAAWEGGDADALAALLREDAVLTMPPTPTWFLGREQIIAFLRPVFANMGAFRMVATLAAGGVALGGYLRAPGETEFRAHSIHVLKGVTGGLTEIHAFMSPDLFGRFGMPPKIDR